MFDVLEMEDADREEALQLTPKQMADVAVYCNRYPSVDVQFKIVCTCALYVALLYISE